MRLRFIIKSSLRLKIPLITRLPDISEANILPKCKRLGKNIC
jgi:hypothetical protein